ncbi:hypothetical protein V865_006652 [Kwoniella europaea PYCC6329]|uniref:Uncharacterized protein n=1 Tax=Kwoniella europaea PYCC6329 TaxID=1423913 RepID=A0AAX4KPZ4_9TREE
MTTIMFDITNLPPLPPSPSRSFSLSSPPTKSTSKSILLSSIKKMPSSVRIFQEQHINEFAHLHLDDQEKLSREERDNMLLAERQKLEEARRIGRLKRQTMAHHLERDKENADADSRIGWRPLSLLARRQPQTKPAQLVVQQDTHLHNQQQQQQQQRQRRFSDRMEIITPTDIDTPDLSSPIPSDVNSPDLALITPNQLGLALGCPSPPLPPIPNKSKARPSLPHDISSVDSHGDNSTYSWASSFSGETIELRTAAHYVPSISEESASATSAELGPEEVLDSPEKVKRRRKRIVAIAHTVRQLEGVGSRDVEDPNFYHQLVKAWSERPGAQQPREPIWSPPTQRAPAPPIPPRPIDNASAFDPYLAPPAWLAPPLLSPASVPYQGASPVPSSDLEHRTPDLDNNHQSQSEENHSNESYASSNPFRYSYASSLHDLALEQGVQHGTKLMSEKAWLRSPLFDQGTWFDANTPSAPLPVGTFQMAPRVPSPGLGQGGDDSPSKSRENGPESGCTINTQSQPQRTLRRHDANIGGIKERQKLGTPIALAGSSTSVPTPAPTNWGLGFLGNWLKDELADAEVDESPKNDKGEVDFQYGEEGMIGSQRSMNMNTRNKISSFLAEGDVLNAQPININDRMTLREEEQQESRNIEMNNQYQDQSMESIPLTINDPQPDLVLPPPLPTPEIEEISNQTGLPKSQINPPPPKECLIVAKEYRYLNPCRRQSYSTPSDILYPHPHLRHEPPLTSNENENENERPQHQLQGGVGDLEVQVEPETEVEVKPSDHQPTEEEEKEGSWDLSEISLSQSQFRTPPLKIHRRLGSLTPQDRVHERHSMSPTRMTTTPQLHELPPLTLSPISLTGTGVMTSTPPRTPKSHLRPVLPPLPPTPKYRRPTPPMLNNPMRGTMNTEGGSDRVGVGCLPHPLPPLLAQQTVPRQNYDRYCYPVSTEGGIGIDLVSQSNTNTNSVMMVEHPSYPPVNDTSLTDPNQSSTSSELARLDISSRQATTATTDLEKALPSKPSSSPSRTPLILFIFGFVLPILWFVGGWPILKPSPEPSSSTEVETTEGESRGRFRWLYHPDPMVRKCRYAAIISTPLIIIAGIVAVVVVVTIL